MPSVDGKGDAAVGWIAHSSYLGAIPKGNRIRGIRARLGNIQVGDERVFDHLFEEERFNRWCVGEVHILDPRIIPNGRRDYFERNPHLRNLENHLAPIFGQISARCRAASSNRNKQKKLTSAIADLECLYELLASGYLAPIVAKTFVEEALQQVEKVQIELGSAGIGNGSTEILKTLEEKLSNFQPTSIRFPLAGISPSEVDAFRRVFGAVVASAPSLRSAREIIDAVLTVSRS